MTLHLSKTKLFVRPHSLNDSHLSREPSKIRRQTKRRLPRWLGMIFGLLFCIIGLVFLELMVSCLVGGGGLHAISRSRYFLQAAFFGVPGMIVFIMGICFFTQTLIRWNR
jgi:Na+-driven multidrug efflux pump